jgi:hypothetical protein
MLPDIGYRPEVTISEFPGRAPISESRPMANPSQSQYRDYDTVTQEQPEPELPSPKFNASDSLAT